VQNDCVAVMVKPRVFLLVIALTAMGCKERLVSPPCSPDATVMMGEQYGVRYCAHLEDALGCSRETGRPVLLLFDAYAQSNHACWDVLANEGVQAVIRDRLVLCVLMVDDCKALSPEDLIDFPQLKSNPLNIGQRNSSLESEFFGKASQPLFTLVNSDFVTLAEPLGYIPKKNADELADWLEEALAKIP